MKLNELKEKLALEEISLPDSEREVTGCYIGDLLSWVMGAAQSGDAWITIMSNINIVAVATLCDIPLIILAENVTVDQKVKKAAIEQGVNILSSSKSSFDLAIEIAELLR